MKGLDIDYLTKKCNWFDMFESASSVTPIQFKNNRLYSIREQENSGVGLRVNVKGKTGLSYTNKFHDEQSLRDVVKRAVNLAAYGEKEEFVLPGADVVYPELIRPQQKKICIDAEIAKGKEVIADIEKVYPKAEINLSINAGKGTGRIINSAGVDHSESSFQYGASCSVTIVLDDGSRIETGDSLSTLNPEPITKLSQEIIRLLDLGKSTVTRHSGKVPLILTPRALASLLNILLAGLNANSIYKKVSPYENKLGELMFDKTLTITDNPLVQNSPSSYCCDDEGLAAYKKNIIEQGVIKQVIADLKYASLTGFQASGNSGRSYASMPSADFSTIQLAEGEIHSDQMIAQCDDAIIVHQFLGLGQSNTLTGDISANLDLGFLVKHGEIIGRVKDCMISDNLFDLFARNLLISSDRKRMSGYELPYVLVEGVDFTG